MAKPPKPRKNNSGCPPGAATMPQPGGRGAIGNPPYVPTDEDRAFVIENAAKKGGVWTMIQLGISHGTFHNHYKKELEISRANACALVGTSLFDKAIGGDGASQRFFLITRGGGEWSPKIKHEHGGEGGGPVKFNFMPYIVGRSEDELRAIKRGLELLAAAGAVGDTGGDPTGDIGDGSAFA